MHALHTVHAMPDLRIAGGVWGTVFVRDFDYSSHLLSDRETAPSTLKTLHTATVKSWRLKVTVKPVEVNSDRALYGSKYPFPFW